MKKILGAIAITATALATTAAFAETATEDQRVRLEMLWGKDTGVASSPAGPRANFVGISSVLRNQSIGQWAANFQGGRAHPPAGH